MKRLDRHGRYHLSDLGDIAAGARPLAVCCVEGAYRNVPEPPGTAPQLKPSSRPRGATE